jgi:hypothetical protein
VTESVLQDIEHSILELESQFQVLENHYGTLKNQLHDLMNYRDHLILTARREKKLYSDCHYSNNS